MRYTNIDAIYVRHDPIPVNDRNLKFILSAVMFATIAAIVYILCTRHGIGILPDSIRYMGIDENPYDAPFYPWMLIAISAAGPGMVYSAKILGFITIIFNSVAIWYILQRVTGKYLYANIGAAIIIFSPQYIYQHSIAMSEPLFISFILLACLSIMKYFENSQRIWLLACGTATGLGALTRFTAPPLGAAIAVVLLLVPRYPLSRRIVDALLVGAVSGAIFFGWVLLSEVLEGRSTGRPLAFYGNMDGQAWLASLESLAAWLTPSQIPMILRIGVWCLFLTGSACLLVWHSRRALNQAHEGQAASQLLALVLGLFFPFYMGFMVLATSVEANLALTGRYAFPAYVTTVMMLTILLAETEAARGYIRNIHWVFAVLALCILAGNIIRTSARTHDAYANGIGYASRSWAQSPVLRAARGLPANATIFSNGADVMGFMLGRRVNYIPARVQPRTGVDDPRNPFPKQVAAMKQRMEAGNAFIVFVDHIDWRFYLVSEADLKRLLNLRLVDRERDGRIYTLSPTAARE